MTLLGKLVFLVATSIVTAQGFHENQEENSTGKLITQEQLARILQAPLFRSNANLGGQAQGYPTFPSQTYDVSEPKELTAETKETAASYVPVPSAILLPPRADALDSYANYRTLDQPQVRPNTNAGVESYNAKALKYTPRYLGPIPNPDSYLSINPHTKQYDLPLPPQPASELQAPLFGAYTPYNTNPQPQQPLNQYDSPNGDTFNIVPAKALEAPYSTASQNYELADSEPIKPARTPTQYYPKKYNSNSDDFAPKEGKNVPTDEFDGDELVDVTKLKKGPKPQKLSLSPVQPQALDSDALKSFQKKKETDKQRHKFEEAQKKIQFKKEQQQLEEDALARATVNSEPIASESGYNDYHEGPEAGFESEQSASEGLSDAHGGAGGDRTEFRMHGQHGPHSYEFGYDTGKGKGRQFRYEQRDNEGYVKGHYGFYDKHGKLQVVNYDAHPHHGFHAEGSFGKA